MKHFVNLYAKLFKVSELLTCLALWVTKFLWNLLAELQTSSVAAAHQSVL